MVSSPFQAAVTNNIPLDFYTKFSDPDGSTPTCTIYNSRYSAFFETNGNNLRLKTALDYDTYNPPHHFYISMYYSTKIFRLILSLPLFLFTC
jgi:hypothetical protein